MYFHYATEEQQVYSAIWNMPMLQGVMGPPPPPFLSLCSGVDKDGTPFALLRSVEVRYKGPDGRWLPSPAVSAVAATGALKDSFVLPMPPGAAKVCVHVRVCGCAYVCACVCARLCTGTHRVRHRMHVVGTAVVPL